MVEAGSGYLAIGAGGATFVQFATPEVMLADQPVGDGAVLAPMHSKVLAIEVSKGERVRRGQRVAVVEAMKMEHVLHAHADGVVADVAVEPGVQLPEGARILTIEAEAAGARR
jgi:3-methylcrotonyl-CoA carboxylase alpha subunit